MLDITLDKSTELNKYLNKLENEIDKNLLKNRNKEKTIHYLKIFDGVVRILNNVAIDVVIEPFDDDFETFLEDLQYPIVDIIENWSYNDNDISDDFIMLDGGYIQTFNYDQFYNIYDGDIFEYLYQSIVDCNAIIETLQYLKENL